MSSKLSIYNGALRLCKQRRLTALTDSCEARRLLDEAWEDGAISGSVRACLEMGDWTFAKRTVRLENSVELEPAFGFRFAFEKPEDFVRPCGLWQDETMQVPLLRYHIERGIYFADIDIIYVQYVSNGTDYGADLSLWPETFGNLVEAQLASEIVGNLTQSKQQVQYVEAKLRECRIEAKSNDARENPTKFFPRGSWTSARLGNGLRNGSRDWPGNSLT